MKNQCLFAVLFFPFSAFAQTLHGIWTGTLVNDTTHRVQNFELGLSEYRGKITGYTYTTFIDNDTFYYSIKRIKAERSNGKLIIEDEEMVGNNFPERAAKHVRQTTVFPLINDSTIDLSNGRWSTTQTKKYYSIGGSAAVKEQQEDKNSDLLAHLHEANIKTDIAVNQKQVAVTNTRDDNAEIKAPRLLRSIEINKTGPGNPGIAKAGDIKPGQRKIVGQEDLSNQTAMIKSPAEKKETPVVNAGDEHRDEFHRAGSTSVVTRPAIIPRTITQQQDTVLNKKSVAKVSAAPDKKQTTPAVQQTVRIDKDLSEKKKTMSVSPVATSLPDSKQSTERPKELPPVVAERKNESIQDIYFKNDSLVLSLYDNGIVDGDTVSVFVNGAPVIAKQMLKASATKKTIYLSQTTDSVQLILFADNLGSIPPNTGLLIVRDGDDSYQVRFSADLQNNASITLRRRK